MVTVLAVLALLSIQASSFQDVYVSGTLNASAGYDTFRIPALCRTSKGTLLAFAEGRRSESDQSSNALVLRRRESSETTWEPLQVVQSDNPNALNNPCVVATREGRVWLIYQRYPSGLNERTAQPGFSRAHSCLTFALHSDDDGRSWSQPTDISESVKGPSNRSDASGPGLGIELSTGRRRGRLVFPFNEGADGHYDVFVVFSDDGGKTWRRGSDAPKAPGTQPNESQVAELADGSLLMNSRNQASAKVRLQCRSEDGGSTWSMATPQPSLVDPVCMGSLVSLEPASNRLALSNPDDDARRQNGVLRLSDDGGKSWRLQEVIAPGSFGYSCLCPLPNGRIGILFESADEIDKGHRGYRIRYTELSDKHPLGSGQTG